MPVLLSQIQNDLLQAQKNRDDVLVSTLRYLNSAIKNKEIELRPLGKELTDEDVVQVLAKQIKQRRESIAEYEKGGREDLSAKEKVELGILEKYLPAQLSEEELTVIVEEAIQKVSAKVPSDMGKVMGVVMPQVKGKADTSLLSSIVKKKLGGN